MWQDNDEVNATQRDWENAKTYCDNLALGGHDDWRLPTINELETIVDYGRVEGKPVGSLGSIDPVFQYVKGPTNFLYYWLSTTYLSNSSQAWMVYFKNGSGQFGSKTFDNNVRCVR